MIPAAVVPGELAFNADGLPWSALHDDIYHPASGPFVQARHVFVGGCRLVERWRGRERFTVLETGFGLGHNFLATWDAWRQDPQRAQRLHFVSVELHPLRRDDLARAHRGSELGELAGQLCGAWPSLTPDLHRLVFDGGRVQLTLAFGDARLWLRQLVLHADALFLDGFAPARNPAMWEPRLLQSVARLAAPGATLATWTAARAVREGLAKVGFQVTLAQGKGGKRDITLAQFTPRFVANAAPGRASRKPGAGRVAIVGGGLAGCATAWALAEQGIASVLFDRHAAPAREASGNPAGMFHPIVNAQDGSHARFNRAAAFAVREAVQHAIAALGVSGGAAGMLRLHTDPSGLDGMQRVLQRLGLPGEVAQACSAAQASALCGMPLPSPAWFFPGGGWVDPAGLSRSLLARAGALSQWRGGMAVDRLRRTASGWDLLGADGTVLEHADTVVLANAGDALRLIGAPAWPLDKVRGQVSMLPIDAWPAGLLPPALPVGGAGYLLPVTAGRLVFGATSQVGDEDPGVRMADHVDNLARLATLTGKPLSIDATLLQGRTAWRWSAADRLPVVGAVPDTAALAHDLGSSSRWDQPRFVPRLPGLHVLTGLGSRGIAWSALGGRVLAAAICGAPAPLEATLLDAIDPARFVSRALRRQAADAVQSSAAQGAG